MGHIYLNAKFSGHPAIRQAPNRGVVLWTRAVCWMNQNGRDHLIPKAVVREMNRELGINSRTVARLVNLGLFEDADEDFYVPDVVGSSPVQLYKFGPVEDRPRQHIPDSVRAMVYERDEYKCRQCGAMDHLSIDHIKPWSLGGDHHESNFQTLCRPCNSRKGATWHASE